MQSASDIGTILITLANKVFCKKLTRKASYSYANNWRIRIQLREKKVSGNENLPIFVLQQREKNLGRILVNSAGYLDFLKKQNNLEKDQRDTC